jgi:phosphatidylglycerophosphatase A
MKKNIILFFASAAYTGYVPVASGTITTLIVGVPLYLLFSNLSPSGYVFATLAFSAFAVYISHQAEIILNEKDSHKIVIDEFPGYLVAMMFLPMNWKIVAAAFVIERFFDILKVFPANLVEKKIHGGLGVVLDDIVAGIYTNLILQAILYFFPDILR